MNKGSYLMGDASKRSKVVIVVISIILYMVLSSLLVKLSDNLVVIGMAVELFVVRGVITQIQMLILVFLVLRLNMFGYVVSFILNSFSVIMSMAFLIRTNTIESLPGVISYLGVMVVITLIIQYKGKINEYIDQSEVQKHQLEESKTNLYKMAYYDGLTNLPNRDYFDDYLDREVQHSKRNASYLSVIFIDLDAFKNVNDTMGHNAGDEVLMQMAKRLSMSLRSEDVIARFGGDEFLVCLSNIKEVDALGPIVKKIMGVFSEPVVIQDIEFFMTASVGVSVYPIDGEETEVLIKHADMAMYKAKEKGKNQIAFCTTEMKTESMRKLKLTNQLYRALDKGELFLNYQPQINVETLQIIGFEALLRWDNGEFGQVSPAEFIPLAEQTGLIKPIGLWVFKEACAALWAFQNIYGEDLRISINVSIEQLKECDIANQIGKIITDSQVAANNIEIEVTESAAFSQEYDVFDRLTEIKDIGCHVAIDDFGKEYSSLNRIRVFPIDRIKIDMDFIHSITKGNRKDKAIVKTIIQLAKNLGMNVLAEGVENEDQYHFLKKEGCDDIQGFYFHRGMSDEAAKELLSQDIMDGK